MPTKPTRRDADDMRDELARRWYWADVAAERERREENETASPAKAPAPPRPPAKHWTQLSDAERDNVRERVELVLGGYVSRYDMGPADESIYFGRYRFIDPGAPRAAIELISGYDRFEDQKPEVMWRRKVWWDSLQFEASGDNPTFCRLFGARNVGSIEKCNLQIPGQMSGDQEAAIYGWHASYAMVPGREVAFDRVTRDAVVTFVIGDHQLAQRPLRDLLAEPYPLNLHIPCRQNFSATIEFAAKDHALSASEAAGDPLDDSLQARIWIHLEGFQFYLHFAR